MKLHVRRYLITGLAALLPTIVTLWLLFLVLKFLHENIGLPFNDMLSRVVDISAHPSLRVVGDIVSIALLIGFIWVVGFILATYIGRASLRKLDEFTHRIPIVRFIYPSIRQVTDFFIISWRR